MEIEYDPAKRAQTLQQLGLDMEDAVKVLTGSALTYLDVRRDYGEERWITVGHLENRMVIVVWTQRGSAYRIISMRKANAHEQETFGDRLG